MSLSFSVRNLPPPPHLGMASTSSSSGSSSSRSRFNNIRLPSGISISQIRNMHGNEMASMGMQKNLQCLRCPHFVGSLRGLKSHVLQKHGPEHIIEMFQYYKPNLIQPSTSSGNGASFKQEDGEGQERNTGLMRGKSVTKKEAKVSTRRKRRPIPDIHVPLRKDNPSLCPYDGCSYKNDNIKNVKSHYIARHCRQKCPHCDKTLSVICMERHIMMVHTKEYHFVCHICSAGFYKESDMKHHMDEEHIKELKHVCEDCGKMYYSSRQLYMHKYRVHITSGRKCPNCGKVYAEQKGLINHIYKHHNGEGMEAVYKNEKGEFRQVRQFKHIQGSDKMLSNLLIDN